MRRAFAAKVMLRRFLVPALVMSLLGVGWVGPADAAPSSAHRCCRGRIGMTSHCARLALTCCTTAPQGRHDSTPPPDGTPITAGSSLTTPVPAQPISDVAAAARFQSFVQHLWDQLKIPRDPLHLRNLVFLV